MDINKLTTLPPLAYGSHAPDDGRACLMEAVAYVAGEPWSDRPACACPVIAAFARGLNDAMPDGLRDTLLRPLIPAIMGTRSTPDVEQRRAYIAADYAVRCAAPTALRAAGLPMQADTLTALPPIIDANTALTAAAAARAAAAADAAAYAAAYAADYAAAVACLREMCEAR